MNLGKKLAEGFAVDAGIYAEISADDTGPIEIVVEAAEIPAEIPAEPATV